ncbi:MAG: endo alpha-1,4 polygalactosaminidase [Ktedonobacteraceae bacterium]|nr:endo alpha-1,4 polygalactosaminidase [Ktedonobacteraceae bacterium]
MQSPALDPAKGEGSRRPWSAVQNWACWLNGPDLKLLGATNFELVVIDYSADGSHKKAFTSRQIDELRCAPCQRRVVSYLSIGQAESYRWYWQRGWQKAAPAWLGLPDPDWEQNYWVHYWDPAWQDIIYRYLDAILAAGFDGIYLDRIDAYQERYAAGHEEDMVQFVAAIAQYARSRVPPGEDFGIIVQNAEELAARHPDYLRLVTGIGREEVYIRATNRPTSSRERARVERHLDLFRQNSRDKLVLTLDYSDRANLVRTAYKRARARGYIPYVSCVALDRLQLNTTVEDVGARFTSPLGS